MKAMVYHTYGSTDNLALEQVPQPDPKDNEVLVRVRAASVNSWDWDLVRGEPFYVRLAGGGLRKPIKKIIGCDVAGTVIEVGKKVTKFKAGDEVFGDISASGWGGFAEYVSVQEKTMTHKPEALSFEEAASLPQAGVMALQAIRDFREIRAGDQVVINGAGGGVGTFAIQLVKLIGAEVTAIDRASKFELMQSLGADHVIDFEREDFTVSEDTYDYIIDVVGHHSLFDFKRALKPGGDYRMIGGPSSLILEAMFIAPFVSLFGNKKMGILGHKPNKNIELLMKYVEAGEVKPVIGSIYPLEELPAALLELGKGDLHGKAIIRI
ncbi:MAG: NAD(P)-dependent alcohol dehydrogenase [Cyclobacteriaceae bacterium]